MQGNTIRNLFLMLSAISSCGKSACLFAEWWQPRAAPLSFCSAVQDSMAVWTGTPSPRHLDSRAAAGWSSLSTCRERQECPRKDPTNSSQEEATFSASERSLTNAPKRSVRRARASNGVPLLLALAVGCRLFDRRESSAGVVGTSFRLASFTIPLVVVDFVVDGFVVVVGCFDMWGPWSGAAGRACRMDGAAAPLLEPNCLAGKDGSVPMMVPWELGIVSRWDTRHGWTAATPQVSMRAWIACAVLRL